VVTRPPISAAAHPHSGFTGAGSPDASTDRVALEQVQALLGAVHDPEIPAVSIVDLGIVERVEVTPDRIAIDLLPTFVGCPALDVIRSSVVEALAPLGRRTSVEFTWRVPWTSDRITERGRAALATSGFAPPSDPAEVHCPYCGSGEVAMSSAFGPTQCRSLFYCRACRQPFEAFKPI
jgi:ring-1,2-phenylacetyl-CoA epoxidase subunit PaaD